MLYVSQILRKVKKSLYDLLLVLAYVRNWVITHQIVQVLYMTCPLFFYFFLSDDANCVPVVMNSLLCIQ